ncbi:MAG: nitric-oxide reductase large subunit [Steroidobacteraceae bacterium]|nr:nitric-oxide reductase large subunit [Steroidobacteraceae bacterium]
MGLVMLISFSVLGYLGGEIYRQAPPIPLEVRSETGKLLYTRDDIQSGQQVYQSIGGQQLGSVWGHGGYVAPDWTADWLHRESVAVLDARARARYGRDYAALDTTSQAGLQAQFQLDHRRNGYNPEGEVLTVSDERAAAIAAVQAHYASLFSNDPETARLREQYAMKNNTLQDDTRRAQLSAFFFWTAWSASTNRPNDTITYTSNWPSEPLVGNVPTSSTYLWTFISILFLIAGIGALVWHHAATSGKEPLPQVPDRDPLAGISLTPSMKASVKYFATALALFLVQVLLGGLTAHYQVEGQGFYGFPLADYLPYSLARTWHTQLGVLWIATAWLGTGLFIAPAVSGKEPAFQRFGVNFLWVALLVIVVGAFAGQWFSVMQQTMGLEMNFWFGHQGWEYVDLGRFWQAFLFVGLMIWLALVGRALWPALSVKGEGRTLTLILFMSVVAIGLFYGAGLMYGSHSHLAMIEYWRWWVVHLWVEGFFEVFATTVIAFLFMRLGLVRASTATNGVLFATAIFLSGGVLGTLHHLYWSGTPTAVLAFGAVFSALEIVPLAIIGFEAYQTYSHIEQKPWVARYRWPLMFFVAVAFWNLVGAGLFGFLINPPLALYYMQGLNTTPLHGHTALFGVYGMLGIGLMLFCLRLLTTRVWDEKLLAAAYWTLNGGLMAMALFSLAPVALLQVKAAVEHGFWFARSPEFLYSPLIQTLVWLRIPGDVAFSAGAIILALWAVKLLFAPKQAKLTAAGGAVREAG